ncbi:sodium:solute symporter family protein [Dyadobacter sp. Leaf189]|uniref:sodium:solute symporter family protein n=1 Tax=Dyadobacter sp. Leaf189 TaxID=1736295 RepID=UPI0006F5BEEC|nr:sodium:solute symporter family protein [Dyadobacter sp. Leaf189]KQS23840.1 sodium:solute symporter [Dyadobacter sp. Leaf189]
MQIGFTDFLVIGTYLFFVVTVGFLSKKQADKTSEDYLLGGRTIPFWMLSISNASGMFDISGTAWMVSVMFVYGVKSIWLPWLWPVFNQVFMMVYMSGWIRKSGASTGAEWMLTRFGTSRDSRQSHSIIIVFAILSCLSFMTYAFIGLGKFLEIFIPWSTVSRFIPFDVPVQFVPHLYGIVFTTFTVFYSLLGGMKSIVWADLVHYVIIVIISVCVATIAMQALGNAGGLRVPEGWDSMWFGKNLELNWSSYLADADRKIREDNFSPFGYFFALMAAKGILASLAGPMPSYDMQKVLSSKTPREAALMSMFVNLVLLPPRYLLITGVTVLGLIFHAQGSGYGRDFERLLPEVLSAHVPAGLLGLVLVGLLGAFMGTFAGTFNAAQAYLVNDVYLKSINPYASNRQVRWMNYISGLSVVAVAIALGFVTKNLNSILLWIVSALYGGYIASNVLKFHWWRFNSYGFFWGMIAGITCAMCCPYLFPALLPLYYFPLILAISTCVAIAASLLTPPTEMAVLKSFCQQVNPWGFWGPVRKAIRKDDPAFIPNPHFSRDAFNIVTGIIAQTALTALPVYTVLLMPLPAGISAAILVAAALILRQTWYKTLPPR